MSGNVLMIDPGWWHTATAARLSPGAVVMLLQNMSHLATFGAGNPIIFPGLSGGTIGFEDVLAELGVWFAPEPS